MKDATPILELARQIELVLKENDIACPNASAIERLRLLAEQMSSLCDYCGEKAVKIASLAGCFYSLRAHRSHPRGAIGLHEEMDDLLHRIRTWALMWGRKND